MIHRDITLPELALVAGTRALLGAGVALLLADKFKPESRRAVGWTLVAVGAATTFPLAANFFFRNQPGSSSSSSRGADGHSASYESDEANMVSGHA